jgi:hypothetical protein
VHKLTHQVSGLRHLALAYFRYDVKYLGEPVGIGMALALRRVHHGETPSCGVTLPYMPERLDQNGQKGDDVHEAVWSCVDSDDVAFAAPNGQGG